MIIIVSPKGAKYAKKEERRRGYKWSVLEVFIALSETPRGGEKELS